MRIPLTLAAFAVASPGQAAFGSQDVKVEAGSGLEEDDVRALQDMSMSVAAIEGGGYWNRAAKGVKAAKKWRAWERWGGEREGNWNDYDHDWKGSGLPSQRSQSNVCHGGVGTPLEVGAEVFGDNEPGVSEDMQTASAYLDYGVVTVEAHEGPGNLLVDVMVQSILLSQITDGDDDFIMDELYGEVVANAFLYKGSDTTGSKITSTFGDGLIFSFVDTPGSTLMGGDFDDENIGNGIEFKSVNTGKFFFPAVDPGSYLVRVEFDLTAAIDSDAGGASQDVTIGEHVIVVTKVGNKGQCNFVEES